MRTKHERPAKTALLLLALPLLVSCGGRTPPAPEGCDRVDLRPRWVVGERYELREERIRFEGTGPFPPEGEIAERSERIRRELQVYVEEVRAVRGRRLVTAHCTFRTSKKDGEPTPVDGKSYDVTDLFRLCIVTVPDPDGNPVPASPEEAQRVRLCALRMAGSLLPGRPVRPGDTWEAGRDLGALAIPGRKAVEMTPVLRSVREIGGRRVATVGSVTEVRVIDGPLEGARMTLEETVRVDVDAERLLGYRAVTEFHSPRRPGRPELWRRQETDLAVRLL